MIERCVFGWNVDEDQLLLDSVKRYKIGGIIVYRKNIRNNFQDFLSSIKKNSINKDIIIAVDQEGGEVRRFRDEDIFVMSARDASELLNPIQYEISVEYMAQKLKKIGITLILAPVVDLVFFENSILYNRSYGTIHDTIKFSNGFLNGLKKAGMAGTLKHFFGYGLLPNDPHKEDFIIKDEPNIQLILEPFTDAVKNGFNGFIMSAHTKFQGEVITYSHSWLSQFLKNNLNFKGKIITDDLMMAAAGNYPLKKKVEMALDAGNDYCIISGNLKDSLAELK